MNLKNRADLCKKNSYFFKRYFTIYKLAFIFWINIYLLYTLTIETAALYLIKTSYLYMVIVKEQRKKTRAAIKQLPRWLNLLFKARK